MIEAIKTRLETLINQQITESDVELVDLVVSGRPNNPQIQVFVDQPSGVTVQVCTELSRDLRDVIDRDIHELNNYRLEVSSPGLDRPLKTSKDFTRQMGRLVQIFYSEGDSEKNVTGRIESVSDQKVNISDGDEKLSVAIESIQKAKIKLKW